MGSRTALAIHEQHGPFHTQALLHLHPSLSSPSTHWGLNKHLCRSLNPTSSKIQVLYFWVICKLEERAWLKNVPQFLSLTLLSLCADPAGSSNSFCFSLFCFSVKSKLLEHRDWISFLRPSLSCAGLPFTACYLEWFCCIYTNFIWIICYDKMELYYALPAPPSRN